MSRVFHFEINADSPEAISKFYTEVFGWQVQKKWSGSEDYWLVHTGRSDERGINGGIKKRVHPKASIVAAIDVENLDETLALIIRHGGKPITPRSALSGTGYLIYCEDPEGNIFSLLERDSSAQ